MVNNVGLGIALVVLQQAAGDVVVGTAAPPGVLTAEGGVTEGVGMNGNYVGDALILGIGGLRVLDSIVDRVLDNAVVSGLLVDAILLRQFDFVRDFYCRFGEVIGRGAIRQRVGVVAD